MSLLGQQNLAVYENYISEIVGGSEIPIIHIRSTPPNQESIYLLADGRPITTVLSHLGQVYRIQPVTVTSITVAAVAWASSFAYQIGKLPSEMGEQDEIVLVSSSNSQGEAVTKCAQIRREDDQIYFEEFPYQLN